MQGTRVLTPGLGRSHMPKVATKPVHQSQLLSLCSRACAPQQEKPPQWEAHAPQLESRPRLPQLENALMQQRRPSAAKKKKKKAEFS